MAKSYDFSSKFQQPLVDTAFFDSPQKSVRNKMTINSLTNSYIPLEDKSYREILKNYTKQKVNNSKPSHYSSYSYHESNANELLKQQIFASVNKSTTLKPKIVLSTHTSLSTSKRVNGLKMLNSFVFHKNTLTDMCFHLGKIWTVGLDYRLCSWNPIKPYSFFNGSSKVIHKRGIIGVTGYKDALITASKDGIVKLSNENQKNFTIKAHKTCLSSLASNSEYFITANDKIKIWNDSNLICKYKSDKIKSLEMLNKDIFLSGGIDNLKLWDVRIKTSVSEFFSIGTFLKCIKWDEYSFWSGSEHQLQVIYN